jgi:type I pantothenate kinase
MYSGSYLQFSRDEWSALRASTPMTLGEDEVLALRGLNSQISTADVEEVFLPMSRLFNLNVAASQGLHQVTDTFLERPTSAETYVLAVAGSVAVGKSTFARVIQALLARWPNHPKVELVATDGFLHSNAVLEERGIMDRKGFPESFDTGALLEFLERIKAGDAAKAPVYSHHAYDVVPGEYSEVEAPDILVLEGLNVLQTSGTTMMAPDFIDFGVFVDAAEPDVRRWYVERFLTLRDSAFQDEAAYFHRFAGLDDDEARSTAGGIWDLINGPNLRDHIDATKERADLIMRKGPDHAVSEVWLRRW